ncbi:MAG: stage II sporulation protein M [Candidatus Nanohaloarchaeota archaeon QJJ-9]|nr:stage II sporulation protein M [Candidatus Nanohaloarchaeota archaeon QJJ-9]
MFEALFFKKEDIDNPEEEIKKIALASVFYAIAGIIVAKYILPFYIDGTNFCGLIAVLVTSIGLSYPVTRYIKARDNEEIKKKWSEETLLGRHITELAVYSTIFLGATLVYGISRIFLHKNFFSAQSLVINSVNSAAGNITANSMIGSILANNFGVFLITFALGFLVSGGIVFILIWNASILGAEVGSISPTVFHVPLKTMAYLPHGLLEIAAYILAGLSGTLLSFHLEHYFRHGTHSIETLKITVKDISTIFILGLIALLLAGIVETGTLPF